MWLLLLLTACAPIPEMEVGALPPALESQRLPAEGFDLHYVESGDRTLPLVLFVHGTPGSWKAFASYLNDARLNVRAHLISVDRPGFGLSAGSGPVPAFADQSRWLGELLAVNESAQPAIVVGHSLGGSLVYQLALDHPQQIGGVVSISAPVNPTISRPRWYNQLARMPGARWVIGQDLAYSNDEMMPLAQQLEAVAAGLPELTVPVTIVHGAEDGLVKVANADFARDQLVSANVRYRRYEEDGHFIVWERHDEMVAEIERLLNAAL
ncbi:MAG: alpha/beta fold hydrolase [Pseudomonadales bacterium]